MVDKEIKKVNVKEKIPGRTGTQVTINTANIIDNADGQIFPSVYAQVQGTLGLDIIQLGTLTGIRSFLQAATTPIWGWWSDKHSRKRVLAYGCFTWAIFTILIAFATQYIDLLIYRAITGIGLAVIVPTTQSLIADYFPPETRGKAFGWLGLTGVIGAIVGTIFATAIVTGYKYIFGIDSWRFIFIVWGLLSITVGICVLIFAKDPIRGEMEPELAGTITQEKAERYKAKVSDFKKIMKNRTFMIIVLQGMAGSIPWNGIFFMIIWFEYIGFDPLTSGLIFSVIAIGAALGNLLGGVIGDKAAKWRPKSGRILTAQISVAFGIPLTFIIFLLIPMTQSSIFLYIIFGSITGLLISWSSGGCNNPIFSEVIEPEIRSSAYSVDRMFEGSFAALGTVFVGLAADGFGYHTPPIGVEIKSLPASIRYTNMMALAWAMFLVALIPWILCLILYTFLYKSYPKDYEKMRTILEERVKN
jgi:MFS family permease